MKLQMKAAVAATMKRLYDRKLTTATGGNVSARFEGIMLITPSGLDKASLKADDIAEVDILTGENLTPHLKLSIESSMHRLIYLENASAKAVCHSHPTVASLFSALAEPIRTDLIAESWYLLGNVFKVPYALMGTEELAASVAEYSELSPVLLLENHGAVAVGESLLNAFDRLECLEQAATMTMMCTSSFTPVPLTEDRMKEIDRVYKNKNE